MSYEIASYEIGDAVRMEMDPEHRSWVPKTLPDGTIGHIVGYYWDIRYAARYGIDCYSYPTPGIYERRNGPKVLWPDGSYTSVGNTKPVDQEKHDRLLNQNWRSLIQGKGTKNMKDIERILTREQRIGDLPHTDLWEGDVAEINWNGEKHFALITSIKYENLYSTAADKISPMHGHALYDFRFCDENGIDLNHGGSWCGTGNSKLHRRGHVWRYYNKEPMVFKDIAEESTFFAGLHHFKEVRNPANGLFKWTPDEALQAVRNGLADGFTMSDSFFGISSRPSLRKFHDRDLGERVRQTTIEGFKNMDHLPDPNEQAA